MCILIHHPVNSKFGTEQLQDFYNKNPDGFGAIVKRGDTVQVVKSIGSISEIIDLYQREVSGHEAIIHFRMKTHGDINTDNCHPYEVIPGLWMAHNGILSTGNSADTKMSDTWHYIQKFLRPVLTESPDLIFNPGFQHMIASHIGSGNKFGFMDDQGRTVIINKQVGVVHKDIWYSNTYAWTPYRFGYGNPPAPAPKNYATQQSLYEYDRSKYATSPTWKAWNEFDRKLDQDAKKPSVKRKKRKSAHIKQSEADRLLDIQISPAALQRIIRMTYNKLNAEGFLGLSTWVEKQPLMAARFIYEVYGSEHNKAWSPKAINDLVHSSADEAADVICDIWESMEEELLSIAGIPAAEGRDVVERAYLYQ